MGILIPRQLTKEQYIKLFSNPVSGIACDFGVVSSGETWEAIKNIRYSKSMILKALDFWHDYFEKFSHKICKLYNPLMDLRYQVWYYMGQIAKAYNMIKDLPDSFLFSHRYIKEININSYRKYNGLSEQNAILKKKYNILFKHQQQTLDPFNIYNIEKETDEINTGGIISFTVFPNEHPYIQRQKISKVGMTEKGNIYVLHKKQRCSNGK